MNLRQSAFSIGVFAFVLGSLGSWVPSFWYDELATVYSARRSGSELLDLLRSTDAVHGLYYAGISAWGDLFGLSELSVRLPSAVAVGIAAAGVVVLASRLWTIQVAVYSGLIFALLPRMTWAAVEARSYALTAAFAVWSTVLLLVASETRARWWWLLYGFVLALSVVLFVYLATMVAVHFAIMLLRRRFRVAAVPWCIAVLGVALVTAPFVEVVIRQAGQVGWIPPLDANFARIVFEYQYFLDAPWFGVVFAVIVVSGLALTITESNGSTSSQFRTATVAIAWIAIPMFVMAAYSLVRSPIYLDRYLTFTAPAVALLGGAAIDRLRSVPWLPYLALGALFVVLAPGYFDQRSEWAKPLQMDFSDANEFAGENIHPGECVLFGRAAWNPASQRLVKNVDPDAFDGVRDIGLALDAASSGLLWDEELSVAETAGELVDCNVLWLFTDRERERTEHLRLTSNDRWALEPYRFDMSSDFRFLQDAGFRVDERVTFNVTQAIKLVR